MTIVRKVPVPDALHLQPTWEDFEPSFTVAARTILFAPPGA
jgi:hypothetical protein